MNQAEPTPSDASEVNIEEIMQNIRKEILAKKAMKSPAGSPVMRIEGKRLPPEFYEHLYQAGVAYDSIQVRMNLSKIDVPLLSPLLQRIRQKAHELVIYYVNLLSANQIRVNYHLLRALATLSEELEKDG